MTDTDSIGQSPSSLERHLVKTNKTRYLKTIKMGLAHLSIRPSV